MREKMLAEVGRSQAMGEQVAEELEDFFRVSRVEDIQRATERRLGSEMNAMVRQAVYRAVNGFNGRAPRAFQIALLDRGDHLLFNTSGHFSLSLTYGVSEITIQLLGEDSRLRVPMILNVAREHGKLRFRAIPDSPLFPAVLMSEDQFVYSVVRMACGQCFEMRA